MRTEKNWSWTMSVKHTYASVTVCVLMDILDELQTLNRLMSCHNTLAIPELLRDIKKNTTKLPKRKKIRK